MTTFRSFSIGANLVNGFNVEIIRVQKSQQDGNSRIPARYFGTIYNADGSIFRDLGTSGLNSKQIKLLIGMELNPNPRTGERSADEDSLLNKLKSAKKAMQAAGLDCEDITNKIAELKSQI